MQDSKLLRYVDRYVGSPTCTLITWARKLTPRRPRAAADQSPQKILIVELFEMGAAIMLLPSIAYLRKQSPNVELHVLTTRTCMPVWKAIAAIDDDKFHVLDSGSALELVWSSLRMLFKLRAIRFDLILDFELFMRVSAILVGMLRARGRAGFYKYRHEGLNRGGIFDLVCAYNQNTHISRNYLALTKTGLERKSDLPNLKAAIAPEELLFRPMLKKPSPAELGAILGDRAGEPYLVVCPDVGPTLAVRNYPRPLFAQVIQELLVRYPRHQLVLIGTEQNRETSEAILAQVPLRARCVDLCGRTDFEQLLKIIGGAELLITNDNGPAHFAALTGTKALALFSTDSPFVYGPLGDTVIVYTYFHCSPCISAYNHKSSVCAENVCLQSLAPAKVVELASAILAGTAKFRTVNGELPYLF